MINPLKKVTTLTGFLLIACKISAFDPRPPENPFMGLDGAASMHGDAASSDTTPLAGPGSGKLKSKFINLAAACSTTLIRSDGRPFILCTSFLGRNPVVTLLNRKGVPQQQLRLPSGSLLGGVYAYLDDEDRLVMVDGNHNLLRIKAKKKLLFWDVFVDEKVSLAEVVTGHCGGNNCDAIVSINPGELGIVWFATKKGLVGTYTPSTGAIHSLKLPEGESIHNSFSTASQHRAAIATDRALYLVEGNDVGEIKLAWRNEYDIGSARKPGQLSRGTGATPTFFGPLTGSEFVMITDNADDLMSLLVFDASVEKQGAQVCKNTVFNRSASGTENSAIGVGNTVVVASTYGYPYPTVPEGVGPAVPKKADFVGGMTRFDVRQDRSGCDLIWQNSVKSAAVPKLSTADNLIYTTERRPANGGNSTSLFDKYNFISVDPNTGEVLNRHRFGAIVLRDTLQMAGNIGLNGVFWQGTLGGIVRIEAK